MIGLFMSFNLQADKQIISLGEARKLLGQKSKNLTNEELQILIRDTETVVRLSVRQFVGSKNIENNAIMPSSKVNTL